MDYGMNVWQLPVARMKMNHTLQQSIHVLQCSSEALSEWLDEQVKDNPMLEWNESSKPAWDWQTKDKFRCDWMTGSQRSHVRERADDAGLADWWLRLPDHEQNLREDLKEQLHMIPDLSPFNRILAERIIEALDDDGMLRVALTELIPNPHITVEMMEIALSTVQSLEPAGIAARSIEECISIQLIRKHAPDWVVKAVREHLKSLSPLHWKLLIRKRILNRQQLEQVAQWLQLTDPHPGIRVGQTDIEYITPDAWVLKENGQWVIRWHPRALPQLQLSTQWATWIKGHAHPEAHEQTSVDYLQDKQHHAKRITHHLFMRAHTLQRVMLAILARQELFLERGPDAILALEMREIADELQLHESTVSRAVQGKWLSTPWGTHPLRMFFHSGIRQRSGKKLSPQQIQAQIKIVLSKHHEANRMSDQMVVQQLQSQGIKIARRTVNKYRHQLGIPCSYERCDPIQ